MSEARIFAEERYAAWRLSVYRRDHFACRRCKRRGKGARVQAHHIRRWVDAPELRYDISNGITLCKICHDLCKDAEDVWAPVFIHLIRTGLNTPLHPSPLKHVKTKKKEIK